MDAVIGWLITLLPGIWATHKFILPRLSKNVAAATSATGTVSTGLKVLTFIFNFLLFIPRFIVKCLKKMGFDGIYKMISKFFSGVMHFPIIAFITMVLSQYFTNLIEKIFLVVGAVSIKIALIFVKWGKDFFMNLGENHTEELKTVLGDSVAQLPPCMVDVMGYMHLVENIGMLVTTLIFVGIVKLIFRFIVKFAIVL